MTRAKAAAQALVKRSDERRRQRAKARRSLAAARLRVCANVFAGSRIHFDPQRRDARTGAIDAATADHAPGAAATAVDGTAVAAVAAAKATAKITIH